MKILFTLFSSGKASGGHYHSLDQISREIGNKIVVNIVTIGDAESPVLSKNPYFKSHINLQKGFNSIRNLSKGYRSVLKDIQPDVIHFFDTESMNWLLALPLTWRYPIVLNKCGGPNPRRLDWQHSDELILFSKENHEWFEENVNYDNASLHLVPNRVNRLRLLSIEHRVEQKDSKKINFVRVSRLGGAYEKTLWDSLEMIEFLRKDFDVHLYVVGRIQDKDRFSSFEDSIRERDLPVTIISDSRASSGSDFLYLADFVIGTGRSFMEALSLGIPCLTPASNSNWPVLVNEKNFQVFFKTNFSERNIADKISLDENLFRIRRLIESQDDYVLAQSEAFNLFNNNFSLEGVASKYRDIYISAMAKGGNGYGLFRRNFPYILKSLLSK